MNNLKCFFLLSVLAVSLASFVGAASAADSTGSLQVSLLNQDPDPAKAGEMLELRFMLENTGGSEVRDQQFELMLDYPFVAVPGETYVRTVSTLGAYQQDSDAAIIKYKVRIDENAVKGTNEVRLKRTSATSDIPIINTFDVEIQGTEFAQILYVNKAKIDPGKETTLNFTIANVGNSPLQNILFSWSESGGVILPVYSDDTKYVNKLDVGESVTFEYTVVADVNADSGLYPLDLSLQYDTSEGATHTMETKVGVLIGGETDFDVTFSESSAGQTSLSVANVGNNPALSVTVRVPDQESFKVSGSTSSIIGNLDKGDYTIVSFQIASQSTLGTGTQTGTSGFGRPSGTQSGVPSGNFTRPAGTAGGSDLKVLIEYTDTTGQRHSVQKNVSIQFRDITSSGTSSTVTASPFSSVATYVLIAALAAVVAVAFFKRKKLSSLLHRGKK
jgi:hypothetical protein